MSIRGVRLDPLCMVAKGGRRQPGGLTIAFVSSFSPASARWAPFGARGSSGPAARDYYAVDSNRVSSHSASRSLRLALRDAVPMPIDAALVTKCVLDDPQFRRAWTGGINALAPHERRGRLCVQLGQVAEAVATLLFEEIGLDVFAQLTTAGTHGVDLLVLTPGGQVLAVEVKGTLRAGALPRLGRGRRRQMSLEWLSSPENPVMVEWDLAGQDVYGCVALLDLAAMTWRAALTTDYVEYMAVLDASELLDPPLAQAMSGE